MTEPKCSDPALLALAFSFAPEGGPVLFRRCVEAFGGAEGLAAASSRDLAAVERMPAAFASAWRNRQPLLERAARTLAEARERGVAVVTAFDPGYPESLRNIYDPPIALYVRGRLEPAEKRVAIVGSRETSDYGLRTAAAFGRELAASGAVVVSGLAIGIDSAAHSGALAAKGTTWAVLGGGILCRGSYRNVQLAERIEKEGGAVLSEFPLHEDPRPEYYPRRNRIVSGLSQAVVVIEAGRQSGALITAGLALEQGRDVFAVPANVDSVFSEGSNWLLRQGAKAVFSASDVLEDLGYGSGGASPRFDLRSLSDAERGMLSALSPKTPLHLDDWVEHSGRPAPDAMALIATLVIKGAVQERPGKFYAMGRR